MNHRNRGEVGARAVQHRPRHIGNDRAPLPEVLLIDSGNAIPQPMCMPGEHESIGVLAPVEFIKTDGVMGFPVGIGRPRYAASCEDEGLITGKPGPCRIDQRILTGTAGSHYEYKRAPHI